MNWRLCFGIVFFFFLALAQVHAQAQTALATGSQTTSGGNNLISCQGVDWTKMATNKYLKRCDRFRAKIMEYYQKYDLQSLGIDPLHLFVLTFRESDCSTREEMLKRKSSTPGGGPMQVDDPCHYSFVGQRGYTTDKCPTLDIQLEEGVKEYKSQFLNMQRAAKARGVTLTPEQTTWLLWFSYNRGIGTTSMALSLMKDGATIQKATDEACQCYYGRIPDGTPANCKGRSNWKSYKRLCTHKGSIGIQYAGVLWDTYKEVCKDMGGKLVTGAGIEFTAATAGAPGAGVLANIPGSGVGGTVSRPPHPAFSVPYSVDPSFNIEVPYDFSVFENISGELSKLDRCRADLDCIKGNITLAEKKFPEFNWIAKQGGNIFTENSVDIFGSKWKFNEHEEWEQFCEPPDVNAVNSLAEAITECMRSPQTGCKCEYKLPVIKQNTESTGRQVARGALNAIGLGGFMAPPPAWKYRDVKLTNIGSDVEVSLLHPSDAEAKPQKVNNARLVKIDKDLGKFFTSLSMNKLNDVLSYDSDDSEGTVDIYKDGKNNFSLYSPGKSPAGDKKCTLNTKIVKFCIINDKKFTAYDKVKNRFGLMNMVLKFAYIFKQQVSDVKGFEISDAVFAQNTSLLTWLETAGVDTSLYTIYRFNRSIKQADLKGKTTEDIVNDPDLRASMETLPFDVSTRTTISDINWPLQPKCIMRPGAGVCDIVYDLITRVQGETPTIQINPNVLYFIEADGKKRYFVMLDGVNDGDLYTYGITATDTQDQESPMMTYPAQGKYQIPKDDLPPGFPFFTVEALPKQVKVTVTTPTQSIDGITPLAESDIKWFKAYCFDPAATEFDLTKSPVKTVDFKGGGTTEMVFDNVLCLSGGPGAKILVTAVDKNDQEYKVKITDVSLAKDVVFIDK